MRALTLISFCIVPLWVLLGHAVLAQPTSPSVHELPASDRKVLEQYLGKGVIGEAVEAKSIDDAPAWYVLREGEWEYTLTGGNGEPSLTWSLEKADDKIGASWRIEAGTIVRFATESSDGDVEVVSEIDHHQGVVSKFSPGERRVIKGLHPGETKDRNVSVKVYNLKHRENLEHQGSLAVTTTYLGAYKVTVPAGDYEAVLIRSNFKGTIGPANVEDTVYHLYAKDVGLVAYIELKNISAMLFYHDNSKVGYVLEKATTGASGKAAGSTGTGRDR